MGIPVADLIYDSTPSVVIGQYPEPFFPNSRVVPNLLPVDDSRYKTEDGSIEFDFVFTPSNRQSAGDVRWGTKGAPETVRLLRDVQRRTGAKIRVINNRPLAEVMEAKRRSRVVIDELITGSYHLSGLEGLSLGKPVVSYLNPRMERLVRYLSGSDRLPFVNTRIEDACPLLEALYHDTSMCEALGHFSRKWIEQFWNESRMVGHFEELYNDLLVDPTRIVKQPELCLDSQVMRFFDVDVPDYQHIARVKRFAGSRLLRLLHRLLPRKAWKRLEKMRWRWITRTM